MADTEQLKPTFATHPDYDEMYPDWVMLRDSEAGEKRIKEKTVKYLPPTPGQVLDGMNPNGSCVNPKNAGYVSYTNYLMRAVYPDFFGEGIQTLVGVLNDKAAKITLPEDMKYLEEDCTFNHETIHTLLRQVHTEILTTGRCGLFADLPKAPDQLDPRQYLAMYKADKILNWDDGSFNEGFNKLNMVLLDESGYKRDDNFVWKLTNKCRVLTLGALGANEPLGVYQYAESEDNPGLVDLDFTAPQFRGRTLQEIPFVFVGPTDMATKPDKPPLLGLARLCMTIYRSEADYRYSLFMQGQETLVVVGGLRPSVSSTGVEEPLRVGADARIDVEAQGDAKYIGISSAGIPEQRAAIEADRQLAAVRTGQLLAPGKMSMESGEALKTRVAAQTATLTSIALAAAASLQEILRKVARWRGSDPDKVHVVANLDFTSYNIQGQDVVQLITAKGLGAPLSMRTIHTTLRERGLTRNTFEEEVAEIKADPKELTDLLPANQENAQSLAGNNPTASAGGPAKSTQGKKAPSNKQT